MVGSNEFEDSWLDEGINTYCEIQIMRDVWGKEANALDFMGFKADDMQLRRYSYLKAPDHEPVNRNAWEYYNHASYRANSYSRPAMALLTLDNYLGYTKMRDIISAYYERWKFRHPKTQDFVDVANEVAGRDLTWFFDQLLHTNAVLDYSVDLVSSEKLEEGAGFGFNMKFTGEGTVVALPEKLKPDDVLYENKVWIRRLGEFVFPVEILMEFESGEKKLERWDGKNLWFKMEWVGPDKLTRATIDPNRLVPLDVNMANNSLSVKHSKKSQGSLIRAMPGKLKLAIHPGR